ncbi:MAG: hypothetical protein E7160_01770 [Firmicutes bacterium]|nr:hypothetical protein [Bacillota bacterium]
MKKIPKILITLLLTILSLMVLNTNVNPWQIPNPRGILYEFIWIVKEFDIGVNLMGIFIFVFYYNVYFDGTKFTKTSILNSIISSISAISLVIGKLLQIDNIGEAFFTSTSHFIKCGILFIGYYLIIYSTIKYILKKIDIKEDSKMQKKKSNKLINFIEEHYLLITIIFLIICRLPYLIIHFPFTANGDTYDVLCQIFHNKNSWTISGINLQNPDIYLNTHHPLLWTLVYGLIIKIGLSIHSLTLGVFLYTLLQTILTIIIYTFLMYYLKKINLPVTLRILILLFVGLNPTINAYATTAVKDTPSALFTLLYCIFLIQILRDYKSIFENKIRLIFLMITMFLVLALRNNGIITILLSYPFLFIIHKKDWKKLLITLMIPIIILMTFNSIMYNVFDASKGSKREYFSIPFMQIARLMRNGHDKEFTKKDKQAINKVLKYNELAKNYYPDVSDPVKDTYRKNVTNKDLIEFFKVWAKYLFKHPKIYIKSFIASTNKYFYPNGTPDYAMLGVDRNIYLDFDIKEQNVTKIQKQQIDYFNSVASNIPIIGLLFRVAFYDWVLLISCGYILYKKKYKNLIPLLPLVAVLLVCLASPLNGSMRYILPITYSIPICIVMIYMTKIECQKN